MHENGQIGPKVCDPTMRMKPQSDSALQSHDGQGPIGRAGKQAEGPAGTSTILTSTSTSPTLPKQKVLNPIPKAKGIDNVKRQVRAERDRQKLRRQRQKLLKKGVTQPAPTILPPSSPAPLSLPPLDLQRIPEDEAPTAPTRMLLTPRTHPCQVAPSKGLRLRLVQSGLGTSRPEQLLPTGP